MVVQHQSSYTPNPVVESFQGNSIQSQTLSDNIFIAPPTQLDNDFNPYENQTSFKNNSEPVHSSLSDNR
jgi:hypothetical protein